MVSVKEGYMFSSKTGALFFIISLLALVTTASNAQLKIAKLKYNGGGDWYANKSVVE